MGKKTAGKWKQAAAAMKAEEAEVKIEVAEEKEASPKAASPPSLESFAAVVEAATKAVPAEEAPAPAACGTPRDRSSAAENRTSGACACVVS